MRSSRAGRALVAGPRGGGQEREGGQEGGGARHAIVGDLRAEGGDFMATAESADV